jgi:Tfp pilus assembly PilM family ATPase
MSKHQRGPIGLEINPRNIVAVQASRTRSAWRVDAAAVITRPADAGVVPGAEELHRLQDVLYRQGFTGNRIVVSVPDSRVLSGTIELPPAQSGAPLEQLARGELARMHRKDPDSIESAAWKIPAPSRAGNFTYMMAAGCPRQDVEKLLDSLEGSGLSPVAVDIRAWAMMRACEPLLEGTSNVSAILDLSEGEAVLAVVHSQTVVYERLMSESGLALLRMKLRNDMRLEADIADFLLDSVGVSGGAEGDSRVPSGANAGEAIREYFSGLIQEFRTALAYAVHRYPSETDRVLLQGQGAAIPGLAQTIAAELGVEIGVVTPGEVAEVPEWLGPSCASPAMTTALGLSKYAEAA